MARVIVLSFSVLSLALLLAITTSVRAYAQLTSSELEAESKTVIADTEDKKITIAALHFAPELAKDLKDLQTNTETVISAMVQAKAQGAQYLVTPELALTGYTFKYHLGTDWLQEQGAPTKSPWLNQIKTAAKTLELGVLLSHVDYDHVSDKSYNSLLVINSDGELVARHRKIRVLSGSESWSSPGQSPTLVNLNGVKVGLLICADLWPPEPIEQLKNQGAELIISPVNWWPGEYGPGKGRDRIWEKRARESGLPILVANRTGLEKSRQYTYDMSQASSVWVWPSNQNTLDWQSEEASLLIFDVNLSEQVASLTSSKLSVNP